MSSKVTAKLRLGAAFSVLLISLALLAGCKQEADNSYTPPGYQASVGYLTDTVWRSGSDIIKFVAEGKVTVPDSWKVRETTFPIPNGKSQAVQIEFNDFTYSGTQIYGKVTKVEAKNSEKLSEEIASLVKVGGTFPFATFTVPLKYTREGEVTPVTNYYGMEVEIFNESTPSTFNMEDIPTSEDKFVGTYDDNLGRKAIQINTDGTFVTFTNGEQRVSYWKKDGGGTIYVKPTPFGGSPKDFSGGSTYYLYPHALMSYNGYKGSPEAWK